MLRDVGLTLPIERLTAMEAHLGEALAQSRTAATLMSGFSLLALLLATMGIYAMVAFSVAGRAGEMGVRSAMGAPRARLIVMVVGESLVPVWLGMAVGLTAVFAASPAIGAIAPGVGGRDPFTLVGAVFLLTVVAAAASWLPAWRASRADPMDALRAR
jgi:ABC-type antimicrobial peptide transport system permease subunit